MVPAKAREIRVEIDADPLASFVGELGEPEGLWLQRAVSPEDVAAAAALPSLRELHVLPALSPNRPANGQITGEMVAALRGKRLERLRLEVLSREALAGLAGLDVRALAVTLGRSGEADLAPLFALPVEALHLKGQGVTVPVEAIERLAATGTVRTLDLTEVDLSAEAIARLSRVPSLRSLTLDLFGAPGEVRIEGAPALAELELLGTRTGSVTLAQLPALAYLDVEACPTLTLRELPRLSVLRLPGFAGPLRVSLAELPALRQLLAYDTFEALTLASVPGLVRCDLRGATLSEAVLSALKDVEIVRDTPVKRRKRVEPKRKVTRWANAKLGSRTERAGVLIAGRLRHRDLNVAKTNELMTACEWWAQQEGRHIAAVVPQMVGTDEVGAPAVIVGEVLAVVREGETTTITPSLEGVDARLAKLYEEACGVVGDDELAQAETRLYLAACGPGACVEGERVRLDDAWRVEARGSGQTIAADVLALPWVALTPAGELTLTFQREAEVSA